MTMLYCYPCYSEVNRYYNEVTVYKNLSIWRDLIGQAVMSAHPVQILVLL